MDCEFNVNSARQPIPILLKYNKKMVEAAGIEPGSKKRNSPKRNKSTE